jgi:hypothetical protein
VRSLYVPHRLYPLSGIAIFLTLEIAGTGFAWSLWILSAYFGILTLICGGLWRTHTRWTPHLKKWGIHSQPMAPQLWLFQASLLPGAAQIIAVLFLILGVIGPETLPPLLWRLGAALTLFPLAAGVAMMSTHSGNPPSPLSERAATASLHLTAVGLLFCAWSLMDPAGPFAHLLQYTAICFFLLVIVSLFYGQVLYQKASPFRAQAIRRSLYSLVPFCGITLLLTLGLEWMSYLDTGNVPIPGWTTFGVSLALIGAACTGIRWAVTPEADPLRLRDSRRSAYVYAAEIFIALLVLHLRLTLPWLFAGFIQPYWPVLAMLLAYTGFGLGEWFERRKLTVLARPVSQTALFLPLLPIIGFWLTDTPIHYSYLLLMAGTLYGVISMMRHSFALSIIAAVFANGALWFALHQETSRRLIDHPQIWLLPFALSVLAAAALHRERLSTHQMGRIRYICASMIYLSSPAEMFIQGVAEAPWLPLILMFLSTAGVFAGIMLRIQSFLYAGCAFLILSLLTILYHASAHHGWTWIWYIAGIGLGILTLLIFAAFENRRETMIAHLNAIRHWPS